jgi:hypothetical protein
MSFTHDIQTTRVHTDRGRQRPSFSSHVTSDRLREGERASSIPKTKSSAKPLRRSVFREEGLDDMRASHSPLPHIESPITTRVDETSDSKPKVTFDHILKDLDNKDKREEREKKSVWGKLKGTRPTIKSTSSAPPGMFPTIHRAALIVLLICVAVPGFRYSGGSNVGAADAGVIMSPELVENGSVIEGRQNSPTSVCTRWAHQSRFYSLQVADWIGCEILTDHSCECKWNFVYFRCVPQRVKIECLAVSDFLNTGGQATTQSGQTANTWSQPLPFHVRAHY